MSYSTMFSVPKEGELEQLHEYHNSWQSAMLWWSTIADHYRPGPMAKELHQDDFEFNRDCFMPAGEAAMSRVWELVKHPEVHDEFKTVLYITFDRSMIRAKDLERFAKDLELFVSEFGAARTGHAWQIHLDVMKQWRKWKSDGEPDSFVGICFNWTSVTDAWHWHDEESDESRLYDVSKDEGHWFLYQEEAEDEPELEPA